MFPLSALCENVILKGKLILYRLVEEAEKRLMEDLLMDCPRNAADVQQVKTKAAKPVATTKGRPG